MGEHYTSDLPSNLYRAEDVRALDRIAIQEHAIPGFDLMSRAGTAAFDLLRTRWPRARRITVFCGSGNNGGDGYVIAALAEKAGLETLVLQVGDPGRIQGDAQLALQLAQVALVPCEPYTGQPVRADIIVDALLGTGLNGAVRPEYGAAIATINEALCPVLAVDIPSGLNADTGAVMNTAVHAQATITFIGLKQGLFTGHGPDHTGTIFFADLDVPSSVYSALDANATLIQPSHIQSWLPPRPRIAHKGNNGHVLVIGGDHGMGGAVAMAAEAAARAGAGLVSVVTRSEHVNPVLTRRPECMVLALDDLSQLLQKITTIVIGPGLGQSSWGQNLLRQALASGHPLVLDADGLNLLARWRAQSDPVARRSNWILTPHPGEAVRLLQGENSKNTAAIQRNRFDSIQALQQQYGATVVLKGAGSLIAAESGSLWLSRSGNPGMASGGMGDVLSGIIGGLLAQGLSLEQAAVAGTWIHGTAADSAVAQGGERGLLATDLMPFIRAGVNGIQNG